MIKIVAIGRIKEKYMNQGIDEYLKRLKPIVDVSVVSLNNAPNKETDIVGIVASESKRILEKIDEKDFVILLDLKGKNLSSVALAEKIESVIDTSKDLVFVIGGSHGIDENVRKRADFVWKLSDLTFPHQFVRMMLVEQIYRSFMIIRRHPYHK